MTPLVSIIIPLYNTEKYIGETILSAINQTWPHKEIIIVDDGSTDDSLSIANQYTNSWITIISQQNKGASAARNNGLRHAKGKYIQFLDADDLLGINKIEEQVLLLEKNPGKISTCSMVHFHDNQNPADNKPLAYEDAFLYDTDDPPEFLINLYGGNGNGGSMIQTNSWLAPLSVIKKAGYWSDFNSPDDDGDFFCRVVLASKGIAYAKDCVTYYRKFSHNNSWSSIKTKAALNGKFQSFLLKKQHLLNSSDDPRAKKALAHSAMGLIMQSYPTDKNLTAKLLAIVKELGGTSFVPEMGGKYIEFIKRVLGWKTARLLQHYLRKHD